jgi:diguanylate cyclase (GGDEF)-like protein
MRIFFKSGFSMRVVILDIMALLGPIYILTFFTIALYTGKIAPIYAVLAYISSLSYIICFIVLQTQKKETEILSITDHLTKLYNRRYFSEMISRELSMAARQKKHLCFLMLDLDKFKNYNDAYGHLQGDELLISISKILKKSVRRSSDLLFRMGGEEFGALLPDTDREGGLIVAENIRTAVSEAKIPLLSGEGETKITISIGVACVFPHTSGDANSLLKLADSNLYKSKATGRNKVVG